MNAINMPALGQTTEELIIVGWLKAEGDSVKMGEPLYQVETDKTTLEVESTFTGTLLKIMHPLQTTVQVGDIIAYIGAPGEAVPTELPRTIKQASVPELPPMLAPSIQNNTPMSAPVGKVLATPAARQLAKEHGIDLAQLSGSGPDGRIEKEDVQAFLK